MASSRKRRDPSGSQDALVPYNLPYRIKVLSQTLERRAQATLGPYDLTPFHWQVLCCLWQEDGLPTLEIGQRLRQLGGTLTGVLDNMEKRGLIRRERDAQDRRIYRVWLTPAGEKLQEELIPRMKLLVASVFSKFTEEETKTLGDFVTRLDEANRQL